jgi:hypothetical protein
LPLLELETSYRSIPQYTEFKWQNFLVRTHGLSVINADSLIFVSVEVLDNRMNVIPTNDSRISLPYSFYELGLGHFSSNLFTFHAIARKNGRPFSGSVGISRLHVYQGPCLFVQLRTSDLSPNINLLTFAVYAKEETCYHYSSIRLLRPPGFRSTNSYFVISKYQVPKVWE